MTDLSVPSLSTIIQLNEPPRTLSTAQRLSVYPARCDFSPIFPLTATRDYYFRAATDSPQRVCKVSLRFLCQAAWAELEAGMVLPSAAVEAIGAIGLDIYLNPWMWESVILMLQSLLIRTD